MNRSIKFRAWVKRDAYPPNNKEVMVPVTGLEWDYQKGEHLVYVIGGDPNGIGDPYFEGWEIKTENCELMQFTGLQDKNRTDIYEGDIIEFEEDGLFVTADDEELNKIGENKYRHRVYFSDEDCAFEPLWWLHEDVRNITVVGNVFMNPELLQGD